MIYKHADKHTHIQIEIWMMAACFSCFPFPRGTAKALEALVILSVSICDVSKILEERLWPFNVKGVDFLKHQSSEDLRKSVTVDSCQYTCKVCACQSSISCAELLASRGWHLYDHFCKDPRLHF